eukprot:1548859-Prymnesium_polylepis.1
MTSSPSSRSTIRWIMLPADATRLVATLELEHVLPLISVTMSPTTSSDWAAMPVSCGRGRACHCWPHILCACAATREKKQKALGEGPAHLLNKRRLILTGRAEGEAQPLLRAGALQDHLHLLGHSTFAHRGRSAAGKSPTAELAGVGLA